MKKALFQKKHILRVIIGIVFIALFSLIMIRQLGILLDPEWSEDGLDQIRAFHAVEVNSLDVIIYGSSHAWRNCDTRVMYEDYGMAAHNYGANWQSLNTTLLFLQDSFRTQTPKIACIETFKVDEIMEDVDMDGQIYYTRAIPYFKEKGEYLNQCFAGDIERYLSYELPLIMFHDNWSNVTAENFRFPGYQRYLDSRGYCIFDGEYECVIPDYSSFEQKKLSKASIDILDKIVTTCKNNGTSIIFFTTPYEAEFNYGEALTEYAKQNGCEYINMFEKMNEVGIEEKSDFQDGGHLNVSGARKVAEYLAEFINEKGML